MMLLMCTLQFSWIFAAPKTSLVDPNFENSRLTGALATVPLFFHIVGKPPKDPNSLFEPWGLFDLHCILFWCCMFGPLANPSEPPARQVACSPRILISREVFRTSFWMRSYAAKSMKRTMVLSNRSIFTRLGSEANKPEKVDCEPTTRRYVDQHGRTRYAGTSRLKESQTLVVNQYHPV